MELNGGTLSAGKMSPSRSGIKCAADEAYFSAEAMVLKTVIDIPIILVGGIRSFQVAEKLMESQTADYIYLSRPLIREPELINRWKSGDMSRALCLSDNLCLQTCLNGNGVYCTVAAKEKEAGSLNP